jgi:DNA-binding transcriptional MerR regulator
MDELLTPSEVADRVRRPHNTLKYWRAMGLGPRSANIGGRVLYRASDVESWIAEQIQADGVPGQRAG